MELLIAVLSGFVAALLIPWVHRLVGDRVAYLAAVVPLGIAVYFGRYAVANGSGFNDFAVAARYRWAEGLDLSLSLYLDGLSLFFVLVIAGIGVLIFIYAGGYFAGDPRLGLFLSYMLIFMAAMLGLVLANNVLTLYVFWELTTLSSFLLIGFEHEKESARSAALQSLLITALGGLALLAGLVLLGIIGETFEISELLKRGESVRNDPLYVPILCLVLIGAFTKSAQFPFHFWLPNAMQAPTPVSAYLHSATMVKAGVYLLARLSPVLGGTVEWMGSVTTFGAITMLVGAYLAFFAHDLKAILAYLTINVLGTLVMLLGLGTPLAVKAAMTYLLAHALYKGALFLMAGAVDHSADARDIRELGGLWRRMPLTAAIAVLAALSMAGVLPLFGFVAKELYLEAASKAPTAAGWLTAAAVVSSLFVVAGAGLVAVRPFFGSATDKAKEAHEAGFRLWMGPLLLATAGIAAGLLPQTLAAPLIGPAASAVLDRPVPVELALWHGVKPPFILSMTALAAGVVLYSIREAVLRRAPKTDLPDRWGPNALYGRSLVLLNNIARWQTRLLQTGYLRHYVLVVLATAVTLAGFMLADVKLSMTPRSGIGIRFYEVIAAGLVLSAAIAAVRSTSRFQSVTALGVVGFSVAWIYNMFGAPDLAMTQIVIESLTVILFVLTFYHLPKFSILSSPRTRLRDAALALCAGGIVTLQLLLVTSFRRFPSISGYYVEQSVPQGHGRNVVNVILVDFRALDTLGEITVVATAAVGVYALVKLVVPKGRNS